MEKSILSLLFVLLLCGCSGFLDEVDKDLLIPTTTDHYASVLLKEFSRQGDAPRFDYVDLMADNMEEYPNAGVTEEKRRGYKPVYTWQMEIELDEEGNRQNNNGAWKNAYQSIAVANYIIELIDDALGTQAERDFIKGEAYFVRSWCYFLLANLYAKPYDPETANQDLGVPLHLDNSILQTYTRATLAETYTCIIDDLTEAQRLIVQSGLTKSKYHPSVDACNLLFSRIYLYMKNWTEAERYASLVIDKYPTLERFVSGKVHVTAECDDILYSTLETNGGSLDASNYEDYGWRVNNDLIALFKTYGENNDTRFTVFFTKVEGKIGQVYYPKKRESSFSSLGYVNLRVAEAYLNRAEARCQLEGDAHGDMQTFVNSRYAHPEDVKIPTEGDNLLSFILDERRKELCFEDHHRWFDLRRMEDCPEIYHTYILTDAEGNKIGEEIYTLFSHDLNYTLPIPLEERDNNPLIYNNERYEKMPETN